MCLACLLVVGRQDFDEPQLRVRVHLGKVVVFELLLLLLDVVADVASEPEDFGENGVDFYGDTGLRKYLAAGFQGSLLGGAENDI